MGPCDFLPGALAPTDLAQNIITRFTDYLENDEVQSLTTQLKPVLQDIATAGDTVEPQLKVTSLGRSPATCMMRSVWWDPNTRPIQAIHYGSHKAVTSIICITATESCPQTHFCTDD